MPNSNAIESLKAIPKAELHVHIEGTLRPAMTRILAARHGLALPPDLFRSDGAHYAYREFFDLVTHVYQRVAACMRTRQDYRDVVFAYLAECAADNALYVEMIAYPGQCRVSGISYRDMIDGIADGIDAARAAFGIEARVNICFERHRPADEALRDADLILSYPHPYIVGVDLAGGEQDGDIPQFLPAIERVRGGYDHTLGMRLHAGEVCGSRNIRDALAAGVTRIGHGVQVIEDAGLMRDVIARGIVLEVCPTSNLCLVPAYGGRVQDHPLRRLYDAGVKVTLNSDDPGLFGPDCTLAGEYGLAREQFGFTDKELRDMTRTALAAAYIDDSLRARLLAAALC